MFDFEVYGYTAKLALLQMLSFHLLGTYSQSKRTNIRKLKDCGVITSDNTIIELSDYFQQKVDSGYYPDDYFEFEQLSIPASSEAEARQKTSDKLWVFGPTIEKP